MVGTRERRECVVAQGDQTVIKKHKELFREFCEMIGRWLQRFSNDFATSFKLAFNRKENTDKSLQINFPIKDKIQKSLSITWKVFFFVGFFPAKMCVCV